MRQLVLLFICMTFILGASAMNQKDEKIPAAAKTWIGR